MADPEAARARSSPPSEGVVRPRVPQQHHPTDGPPPRPEVTSRLAPPTRTPVPPRPWSLRLSAAGWVLAAVAGGAGVLGALADGDALQAKLTAEATDADPDLPADAIADGVAATPALVIGSVTVLSVALVVGTALVLRRRAWARWPLLATGLLVLVADDVAQSVVSGGAELDRIALVAQAGLVVAALVAMFWRSSGQWLRPGRGGGHRVG